MTQDTNAEAPTGDEKEVAVQGKLYEIRTRLAEAETAVTAAMSDASSKTAALFALPDTDPAKFSGLGEIGQLVSRATNKRDTIKAELDSAIASDRWETNIAIREPVLDAIREMLIESTPEAPLVSVTGSIVITDEGVKVDLSPVLAKLDLESIEMAVAESIDLDAFREAGFLNIAVNVTKLNTESPVISLDPNAASKSTTVKRTEKAATGTRTGALEYLYRGEWIGSRQLIEQAIANSEPIAVKRQAAFQKGLDTNNAISNYAKDIRDALTLESREKAPSE